MTGFAGRGGGSVHVHLSPAEERAVARLIAWLIHVLPWQWWVGLGGAGLCAMAAYAVWQNMPAAPPPSSVERSEPQDAVPQDWTEDQ